MNRMRWTNGWPATTGMLLLGLAGAAAGQEATCPGSTDPVGHLGFTISCDCTVSRARWPERPWSFRSPIHVLSVEAGGPAAGKLQPRDSIVAVDGRRLTTQDGARRLAEVAPDEEVELTVRRGGRDIAVALHAALICPQDPRAMGAYAVPVQAPSARSLAPPVSAAGGRGSPGPVPTLPDLLPPGRLGLALACRRCGWERETGDPFPRWHSIEPPVVYSVAPSGPADAAGIRPGDVLLEVAGAAITSRRAGEALGAAAPGQALALTLDRNGSRYQTTLDVGARETLAPATDRYTGSIGDVRVNVRSEAPATVTVSEDGGTMIIRVAGTEVRLSTGPGGSSRLQER